MTQRRHQYFPQKNKHYEEQNTDSSHHYRAINDFYFLRERCQQSRGDPRCSCCGDPWEGYEKTPDGTRIILPEPITLDISVAPTHVVNNTLRAAIGDFDGIYSEDERARATVNTPEPEKSESPDNPYQRGTAEYYQWRYSEEYRAWQREDDYRRFWNTNGGEDWIRDLHIPELR